VTPQPPMVFSFETAFSVSILTGPSAMEQTLNPSHYPGYSH
jgi:hypothetical protein